MHKNCCSKANSDHALYNFLQNESPGNYNKCCRTHLTCVKSHIKYRHTQTPTVSTVKACPPLLLRFHPSFDVPLTPAHVRHINTTVKDLNENAK